MTVQVELETYVGWDNIPKNLFTKTQLKDKRLKPVDLENVAAYVKFQSPNRWRETNLYNIDETVEMKKRKLNIRNFELNENNLGEALYIINKSAKKSRDTKQENYYSKNFGVVSRSKSRQSSLYDLKNDVISKAERDGIAEIIGYHVQEHYERPDVFLVLYRIGDFTFHNIADVNPENTDLERLGEIGVISAEKTRKVEMKFNEAVKLLETFSGKED
ncbi:YkyB family protein [Bacillus solitudinis]|uniref:YkyB family protein n=1 Tax=Bacillus solitudinis TaxID=2014074 RepID=UPI000C24B2AF|nr:YkyB family protein [Bacillus solitudinis]